MGPPEHGRWTESTHDAVLFDYHVLVVFSYNALSLSPDLPRHFKKCSDIYKRDAFNFLLLVDMERQTKIIV